VDYWEWYRERMHEAQIERAEQQEQEHYDTEFARIVQALS
jgi:hypothetical protein